MLMYLNNVPQSSGQPHLSMSTTMSQTAITQESENDTVSSSLSSEPSKKRKRESKAVPEIEVDIDAPEPPSKKALRKAKKGKPITTIPPAKVVTTDSTSESDDATLLPDPSPQISKYGIWIGNLPWIATKADLRKFLTSHADIEDDAITRIHMPAPTQTTMEASRQRIKPQNKGFAYVDFSSESALAEALTLSETLLSGRRVLIKDAKSFEGRPEPVKEDGKAVSQTGKPPSRRVFVGNLAFDTTKEELQEHFSKCGEVADCFITTFEDSGKCKGYGWVTFEDLESAVKAVRGWVDMPAEPDSADENEVDDAEGVKKSSRTRKGRKWWVNRIKGRSLRMEFAEDKAVRYKKRFGKGGTAGKGNTVDREGASSLDNGDPAALPISESSERSKKHSSSTNNQFRRTADATRIPLGAKLAEAPRLTGAIVQSEGKKTTFG